LAQQRRAGTISTYKVDGERKRLNHLQKDLQGGDRLGEKAGTNTFTQSWQVDKSSSPGSSKLISKERSTISDGSA
jgi:hypothetical protein